MNIALYQIDGTLPNLALMKLSAYHKKLGDSVKIINNNNNTSNRFFLYENFDKVYISCIFEKNKEKAITISKNFKCEVLIGGVGINNIKLSDEIEHIMPDYESFNSNVSYGFTTRGCIRSCYFCKVHKHEGYIKENCDIYEFWNRNHKEIILMDNNILALPEHFKKIAKQLLDNNLKVDFNQGLDHRLLSPELCKILLELKHIYEIRFAFDDISSKKTVINALDMLKKEGLKDWKSRWYVYVGEKDTFETVYERLSLLRKYKQAVYVMRDEKVYNKPEFIALASWGNTMGAFKMSDFKDIVEKSIRMKPYKKYVDKYLLNSERINKYF